MITTCVYRNGRPEPTELRVPTSLPRAPPCRYAPAFCRTGTGCRGTPNEIDLRVAGNTGAA